LRDFRKLQVWEKSHKLALIVYRKTDSFPKSEIFGLTSQIRRAIISIPTNIAEGCGRKSKKEFLYFLNIAFGSASELQYLIFLSFELKYLDKTTENPILEEIGEIKMMLCSLIKTVEQ